MLNLVTMSNNIYSVHFIYIHGFEKNMLNINTMTFAKNYSRFAHLWKLGPRKILSTDDLEQTVIKIIIFGQDLNMIKYRASRDAFFFCMLKKLFSKDMPSSIFAPKYFTRYLE